MEMSTISLEEPGKKGYRAGEAHIRPWPIAVRGKVESFGFDITTVTFTLEVEAPKWSAIEDEPAPTEIYLPEFHFPLDETTINASTGSYNMTVEKGMRKLKWWHAEGKQSITITGLKREAASKTIVDRAWEGVSNCLETR
jgi:hypothetical protein